MNNAKSVVIAVINIANTRHYLIKQESIYYYLNESYGKLVKPPSDLSILSNAGRTLTYLRKQYFLRYFTQYINAYRVEEKEDIDKLVQGFREFINVSDVNAFMFWPFLNKEDFEIQLLSMLNLLRKKLDEKYKPITLANDGVTKIVKNTNDMEEPSIDEEIEDAYIADPSYDSLSR